MRKRAGILGPKKDDRLGIWSLTDQQQEKGSGLWLPQTTSVDYLIAAGGGGRRS